MDRHVSLAGRILVRAGGATLDERALPGRHARLAFVLLLSERFRAVPVEELAQNLWPDTRPATWSTAVRGVVQHVRDFVHAADLGPRGALRGEHGAYQLRVTDVEVDVEQAVADLEHARALLASRPVDAERVAARGCAVLSRPVLPAVDSPWLDRQRRAWGRSLQRGLEVLAESRIVQGRPEQAVAPAERAVELDPYREAAHRLLITALAAHGNEAAGVAAYERCRHLLRTDLGVEPDPRTRALYAELVRGADPDVRAPRVDGGDYAARSPR